MDIEIRNNTGQVHPLESIFKDRRPDGGSGWSFGINYGFTIKATPNLLTHYVKNAPCHQFMNRLNNFISFNELPSIDRYVSELRFGGYDLKTYDRSVAEAYWNDLLDPENSPWKSVLKDVKIHKNSDGKMIAFSIPVDNKTDNRIITNLSIATRKMTESPEAYRIYEKLLKYKELTPAERILITNLVIPFGNHNSKFDRVIAIGFTPGHHCINVANVDIKRFLNGDLKPSKDHAVMTGGSYTPCNRIWEGVGKANNVLLSWNCFNKDRKEPENMNMIFKVRYDFYLTNYRKYQPMFATFDDIVEDMIKYREIK